MHETPKIRKFGHKNVGYCPHCQKVLPKKEFPPFGCRKCISKEQAVENQQKLADAAHELATALTSNRISGTAQLSVVLDRFMDSIGGPDGYAGLLLEDFNRNRGTKLTDAERSRFQYKESVIQKYHHLIMGYLHEKDKAIANQDLQGISEEELKAGLEGLAMEMLQKDEGLRNQLVSQVLSQDPELVKKVQDQAIKIESEVVQPDEEDDD